MLYGGGFARAGGDQRALGNRARSTAQGSICLAQASRPAPMGARCCHQAPTGPEVLQRQPPRPRGIEHPYRRRDPATCRNHATKPNPEPKRAGEPSEECMYVKIQVLHVGRRGNAVCQQKHRGTKISEPSPAIPIPQFFFLKKGCGVQH